MSEITLEKIYRKEMSYDSKTKESWVKGFFVDEASNLDSIVTVAVRNMNHQKIYTGDFIVLQEWDARREFMDFNVRVLPDYKMHAYYEWIDKENQDNP